MQQHATIRILRCTMKAGISPAWVLICLLAVFLAAGQAFAGVQDQIYTIGAGTHNIYTLNANGSVTTQFTNYSGTTSAALAQRPSDGIIYFTLNVTNGAVFTWNPATPAIAPVQIGTTGAAVGAMPRLAFNTSNVLYGMDSTTQSLYIINQSTGAATVAATFTGLTTGLGGDIAFAPDGTLYIGAGHNIYRASVSGGTVTNLGALSGFDNTANLSGMAFDVTGTMLVCDDASPSQGYSVNLATMAATPLASTMSTQQGDMGSGPRVQISGTVFEDVNYGGGAGRSLAGSSGVGRANVRVELYDSAGNFIASTLTNSAGGYTLTGASSGTYTVRVVNSSVTSSRPGSISSLIGVQTFRTSGLTGTVGTADTNRVGGEDPTKIDAGNGSTTLAALTTSATTAQSITSVTLTGSSVTGIDFGFNFDTIVSTRDSGQGTLRQFIVNSNTLTNAGLAQSGFTAGVETSIFMISGGSAVAGLRAGLTNQLNAGGVAAIVVASQLPAITDSNTALDATTQTTNAGNTNALTLGAGGTVGTDALSLSTLSAPEVQISAARGTIGLGLDVNANNTTVRGLAMFGFGTAANSNGSANIQIENAITGVLIERNLLGSSASGFTDPGSSTRGLGDNIRSIGGDNGTIQNNLIGFSEGKGIGLENASAGWVVQRNEVRGNSINNAGLAGIDVESSSGSNIQQNLLIANNGAGIDTTSSSGSNSMVNNTVTGNGVGTGAALRDMGIRIFGSSNTVDRNVVSSNVGAGVVVTSGASTTLITKNSIFLNGTVGGSPTHEIGIDLQNSTDNASLGTSPFVTLNDSGDADTGGNGLLNYPILQTATIGSGQLTLTGFARPGSVIELFLAAADPSGFGQGKTYLTTLTEGSAADLDSTTGTYGPGAINGIAQGTDTTNKFKFVIAIPAGVSAGSVLTATATVIGATSEFSGNVTVSGAASISGKVYQDANHNGTADTGEDWSGGSSVFVNLVSAGVVVQSVTVPAGAGTYTFNNVGAGTYSIVVTNSAVATTAGAPSGWAFVNPTAGTLQITASSASLSNQTFGLFHGSLVSGVVFKDNGAGGGTANNGVRDGSEAGLAGITVNATNGSSTIYDTTQTAADGSYTLFIAPGATSVAIIETNASNTVSTGASVGTTGGSYNRATDTVSFTKSGEAIYTGVNFGDVPQNDFQPNGAQQALPGTVLFYAHIFTPGSGGQVSFSLTSTAAPGNVAFSRILYQDSNCNGVLDSGEPVISAPVIAVAGTNLCVIMKVAIPAGTPFNATDTTVITANFTYTNASPALAASYTVNDVTTVGTPANAGLRLVKTVDKASALPGANLSYTITFTNDSSSPISSLVVNDSTPAYTSFVSAACGSPLPSNLTGCSFTAPPAGQTGNIQWTFTGTLAPSQSGTVSFVVKIQ